jgi:hypothetical protein
MVPIEGSSSRVMPLHTWLNGTSRGRFLGIGDGLLFNTNDRTQESSAALRGAARHVRSWTVRRPANHGDWWGANFRDEWKLRGAAVRVHLRLEFIAGCS